jgi:hypothetical protein
MSVPFEYLEDRLLRGGIAPRHVKRYLCELDEHLSDIAEAHTAAGYDAQTAAAHACAALGSDDELADAMLKQRDFRSLSARVPWLVFGVLPVLALPLAMLWSVLLPAVLQEFSPAPMFPALAGITLFAGNFIVVPAIALLFVFIARRQRCSLLWPILSTAIILVLAPHAETQPAAHDFPGFSAIRVMYQYSDVTIRSSVTPLFLGAWWRVIAVHGAAFVVQYLLVLLPLTALVHRHFKDRAIA